jgi:YD repeat-containing protein
MNRVVESSTILPAEGYEATTSRTYNAEGLVVTSTDINGGVTRYSYDDLNRVISVTDPMNNTTTYTRDNRGNIVATTDPKGNTTTFVFDTRGQMVNRTDAVGGVTSYVHDALGNLIETIDPVNNKRVMTYDVLSRVIKTESFGAGDYSTSLSTVSMAYTATGKVDYIVAPGGRRTEFEYNAVGEKTLVRRFLDGQPIETSYFYNDKGQLDNVVNEAGRTTQFVYNNLNQLILLIAPSPDGIIPGPVTSYEYDFLGNRTKVITPTGGEWTYKYNGLGWLLWREDPLGLRTTFEYNLNGSVIQKTDAKGQITQYLYDQLNRLRNVNNSDGEWAEIAYDANSNRTSVTGNLDNGSGNFEELSQLTAFDALDRVYSITNNALNRQQTFTYTANGQRQSHTIHNIVTGATKTTGYSYDGLNRLSSINSWNSTSRTRCLSSFGIIRNSRGL